MLARNVRANLKNTNLWMQKSILDELDAAHKEHKKYQNTSKVNLISQAMQYGLEKIKEDIAKMAEQEALDTKKPIN